MIVHNFTDMLAAKSEGLVDQRCIRNLDTSKRTSGELFHCLKMNVQIKNKQVGSRPKWQCPAENDEQENEKGLQ